MQQNIKKEFTLVFYSSLFIFFSTLLLIKLSSEFFILFCLFPLFIIALSTDIKITFLSYCLALVLLIIFFISAGNFIESESLKYLYINLTLIFFLAFLFSTLLKINNNQFSLGIVVSYYNLALSLLLSFFLFFFYFDANINFNIEEIKKTYFDQMKILNPDLKLQIDSLINFIFKIVPALNSIFFLVLTILNFFLAQKLLKKLQLDINNEITFNHLEIPNWYFYSQIVLILIFMISNGNINLFALNTLLLFSSIFIINGFFSLLSFLKIKKINILIKFLLLFLLFIFFSYLLIIFLFILGINRKIKQISNDFQIRGKK